MVEIGTEFKKIFHHLSYSSIHIPRAHLLNISEVYVTSFLLTVKESLRVIINREELIPNS